MHDIAVSWFLFVYHRPPLNTGSWLWTWRRWWSSGRFSGSRRSKRSQRSNHSLIFIFFPLFVVEFLFSYAKKNNKKNCMWYNNIRYTQQHRIIFNLLNAFINMYNYRQSLKGWCMTLVSLTASPWPDPDFAPERTHQTPSSRNSPLCGLAPGTKAITPLFRGS